MLSEGSGDIQGIRRLINNVEWSGYYDLCEELVRQSGSPERVIAELEAIFTEEGLPYSMTADGLQWRQGQPAVEAIEEATQRLVQSKRFSGPAEQWEKARNHLNEKPPDAENCIKDAVGALEGTARIISGQPSRTLGQLIQPLAGELEIHPALASAISNLYGFRSDGQGIGHGATEPSQGLIEEAEMALHWCAAAIVLLVKKSDQR